MSDITQAEKQKKTAARIVERTEATGKLITPNTNVITVIGVDSVRDEFEETCLNQACNIADFPGIDKFVLNPDAHQGYGAPIGSVFSSQDYVLPCAVGPDIACSMSFLQMDLPIEALNDNKLARELINALEARIPLGAGSRQAPKARRFDKRLLKRAATDGATPELLSEMGIPGTWSFLCEDASHGISGDLGVRLDDLMRIYPNVEEKLNQIGSVGGGNHFMECSEVVVTAGREDIAKTFGLKDGGIGFLNHFGSRGFGFFLTEGGKGGHKGWFRQMEDHFGQWMIPFPGGDTHNVYMPAASREGQEYLRDMSLGANFATVNHLLVCTYVLEAFQEVLGSAVSGNLIYYIAHNIIRREIVEASDRKDKPMWVHRKGATRALPAGHHELKNTKFYATGHPILLPGNPIEGSTIMVGQRGSAKALNSVNHGAGRSMSRKKAKESFKQKDVDGHFTAAGILTNCRQYPLDESSGSYKPYNDVIESVELAGLALTVAKLKPRMVIKDGDQSAEGAA